MSVGIRRRGISLYEENGEMSCMYSAFSVGSKWSESGEMVLVTAKDKMPAMVGLWVLYYWASMILCGGLCWS